MQFHLTSKHRPHHTPYRRGVVLLVVLLAMAASCGSDTGQSPAGAPIPVEADGGIGDGAGPLPGAAEVEPEGTWHGAIVAETNCPSTTWQRVEASAFSFSVPAEFEQVAVEPIDSEIGAWSKDGIEVRFDYGWYSGDLAEFQNMQIEPVDYSGVTGDFGVGRFVIPERDTGVVGVFFPAVDRADGVDNRLSLFVFHDDPADEIIGRCIVGSIEWR